MDQPQAIWIETFDLRERQGNLSLPEEGAIRAQFAFRVILRSFKERMLMKWGWNANAAMEESLERLRIFVDSLHPRQYHAPALANMSRRSLALRAISDPETHALMLSLLGNVIGANHQEAQNLAHDFAYELLASFPYDWILAPVCDQGDFYRCAGWDLISKINGCRSIIEIGRYEASLLNQQAPQYLLGEWQWSKHGNELIWRALANSPVPVVLSMLFQPTLVYDPELNRLAELSESAQRIADHSSSLTLHREAQWAVGVYKDRGEKLRFPFLVQIHLASPQGVPPFVERVVGSSLTFSGESSNPHPGYSVIIPSNDQAHWVEALRAMQPILGVTGGLPESQRLRLLCSPREACSVMRLPYLHEFGIPGVNFH